MPIVAPDVRPPLWLVLPVPVPALVAAVGVVVPVEVVMSVEVVVPVEEVVVDKEDVDEALLTVLLLVGDVVDCAAALLMMLK